MQNLQINDKLDIGDTKVGMIKEVILKEIEDWEHQGKTPYGMWPVAPNNYPVEVYMQIRRLLASPYVEERERGRGVGGRAHVQHGFALHTSRNFSSSPSQRHHSRIVAV